MGSVLPIYIFLFLVDWKKRLAAGQKQVINDNSRTLYTKVDE